MIQINRKIGSAVPDVLINKGAAKTEAHKREFTGGGISFKFDRRIYGAKEVKRTLSSIQNGKCCFCESNFEHVGYGDVEHYRPKAGWVQGKEKLNKPGYYWLAYDWDNLLLSCQICNQKYKKNYFPLVEPQSRALDHTYELGNEAPLFIHPANEDPEAHIEFEEELPRPVNNSNKGKVTIQRSGLDRELLNTTRANKLKTIKIVYDLAKGHPETDQQHAAKLFLTTAHQDTSEYASMLRCFFKKNPIDF